MAISAFGTRLQRGNGGSPETFTTIAELADIGGPELTLETIDVTTHQSTEGWREFIGGLLDAGEVSMTIMFGPTEPTHVNLISDMTSRTRRNFKLVFPDSLSTTWSFTALVTKFSPAAPIDDKLAADITLKITGKPTLS